MKQKVKYKGILFIVLSALCFAFMNMFVRMAGDLPAVQKSFFRNLVAFIIALATMVRHKEVFQVEKGNWKYMILRAAFGTMGILCNFYAVDHLVLSDASMLNKMSPFFVILFSFLILKEKLTPIQVTAVCGAFIGSLVYHQTDVSEYEYRTVSHRIVRWFMRRNRVHAGAGVGTAGAERGICGAVFLRIFLSGDAAYLLLNYHTMSMWQGIVLLGAGVAAAGGQFAITAAYYHAPAREISVYDYSQIIFSAIIGFTLFHQIPDRYSVLGYVIIIGMAVWMFFYNQRRDASDVK